MLGLKINSIFVLIVANLFYVNLAELNSIFNVNPNGSSNENKLQQCEKRNEAVQRHTKIDSLEKALEVGLNQSFHDKYECLQKLFDDKLNEMQQFYKQKLKSPQSQAQNQTTPSQTEASVKAKKPAKAHMTKQDKKKAKQQHQKQEPTPQVPHDFLGQMGFIFYAMNENTTITDFKHESVRFVQPPLNQTSEVSQLEQEIEAYNSDMIVLKAVLNNIKKNLKARVNLLKAIKVNEKEMSLENRKTMLATELAKSELNKKESEKLSRKKEGLEEEDDELVAKKKREKREAKKSKKGLKAKKSKKNADKNSNKKIKKSKSKKESNKIKA